MYTVNDVIHLLIIAFINFSGIILNSILIAAILKSTPPVMRTYSVLLFNMACSDLVASVCNLATGSRLINLQDIVSQVTIYLGPCSFISHSFCELTNCINTHTMTHSSALLFCAFVFRLRSLRPNSNSRRSSICTWIVCIALAIPTIASLVAFLQQKEFTASPAWSDPRFAGYTIIVFSMNQELIVALAIFYTMVVITFSTVLAIIARYFLVLKIKGMSTKSSHRTIAKALSFHILLPLFYVLGYTLWILNLYQVYSSEWQERALLIVAGLSSPVSACINLYFLRPYRRFLLDLLTRSKVGESLSSNQARQPPLALSEPSIAVVPIAESSV